MSKRTKKPGKNVVADFKAQERKRNLIFAAVMVLLVTGIIGGAVYATQQGKVDKETELVVPNDVTADYGALYTATDTGGEAATDPVDVVIFEDFSCPACKSFEGQANATLVNLVEQGKIEIEYRIVGFLDDGVVVNDHSKRAASASFCVREQDGMEGWKKFHDWLYDNQPNEGQKGQSNEEFYEGAKDLDLNVDRECVMSERYVGWFQEATDKFNSDGIGGTPTVIVDGTKVEADPLAIVKAVDEASGKFAEAGE